MRKIFPIFLLAIIVFACSSNSSGQAGIESNNSHTNDAELFIALLSSQSPVETQELIKSIESNWNPGYAIMAIETIYLIQDPNLSFQLATVLQEKTGKAYGYRFNEWYKWLWNQEENKVNGYANFKATLHKRIDPKFEKYFKGRDELANIRLDEVRWGGVLQDGIPPLRSPKMIEASAADYLEDDHIIFGIEVNGDVRAYPKRILAWHEMFVDEVGGIPVAGVYCTLCGTVILYRTEFNGVNHEIGTSGFLYRSNKLMYDKATQSLWNTLQGKPVIGPLVNKGIEFEHLSVVTTTWGEWKSRHPDTKVLSLNTGYRRDYGEGVAYKEYFGSDKLMFNTPYDDNRLKNKDEVLALRFLEFPKEQLGISVEFLKENPLYKDKIGKQEFIVLTDQTGANRVYDVSGVEFVSYDQKSKLVDSNGSTWQLQESQLVSDNGRVLNRLPYHRAFWFGWLAAYPNTRLVK